MHILKKTIVLVFSCLIMLPTHGLLANDKQILKIAGWDVYADPERLSKTIGYQGFEKMNNVEIEFTPLSSLDDIVSAAESGSTYDIYIISNEGIEILHDMGLVSPLNLEALPNYQNLHHNLKYSDWSQFESHVYAVPWAWGPTGLLYDTDVIKTPDSWNVLWDPKYKGKISMWDDVSMIWTTALSLGYKNVYSLTKVQLENVKNKLFEL